MCIKEQVLNQLINRTKNAGVLPEDLGGVRSCSSLPVITSFGNKNVPPP
jgi:hypothetical protein